MDAALIQPSLASLQGFLASLASLDSLWGAYRAYGYLCRPYSGRSVPLPPRDMVLTRFSVPLLLGPLSVRLVVEPRHLSSNRVRVSVRSLVRRRYRRRAARPRWRGSAAVRCGAVFFRIFSLTGTKWISALLSCPRRRSRPRLHPGSKGLRCAGRRTRWRTGRCLRLCAGRSGP